MQVSALVWALTIAAIAGLVLFDFYFHVRKAHIPGLREASIWSVIEVGIALLFGVGVLVVGDAVYVFFLHVRKAQLPGLREASIWSAIYVGIALLFGVGVLVFGGTDHGAEY